MNKLLIIPAILFAAQAAYAQTSSSSDPSAAKSRDQVKAEERASGSASKGNIEAPAVPSTKGSTTSRSSVNPSTSGSGSSTMGNTESSEDPSTKGSGVTRSEVKASESASGSLGTKNTDVPSSGGKTAPK